MKARRSRSGPLHAFWDSSALLLLICQQSKSPAARRAQRKYQIMSVWWGTRVECHSALQRLIRDGDLSGKDERLAFLSLERLSAHWVEIQPIEEVRQFAEKLLKLHTLRAADALQLSAALIWCNRQPHGRNFICDDTKLLEAAEKEGFNVIRM